MNGSLTKFIHGTGMIGKQVLNNMVMLEDLIADIKNVMSILLVNFVLIYAHGLTCMLFGNPFNNFGGLNVLNRFSGAYAFNASCPLRCQEVWPVRKIAVK